MSKTYKRNKNHFNDDGFFWDSDCYYNSKRHRQIQSQKKRRERVANKTYIPIYESTSEEN